MDLAETERKFIDLIKIESVTPVKNEIEAVRFLENILKENKLPYEILKEHEEHPNLLARIKAAAPENPPVVLISHIDVAEVQPECWQYPPFGGEIHEGRIFGRGTLDTKQLTMMELYCFLKLNAQRERLNRDIYFLATANEEGGSRYGMEYLRRLKPSFFQGKLVINEGGGFPLHSNGRDYMTLTVGEKGSCRVRVYAKGQASHGSAPGDDQAVLKLADALEGIFQKGNHFKSGSRQTADRMEKLLEGTLPDNPTALDIFRYSSENGIGIRSYCIGQRSNIIPAAAEAVLELKVLPGTTLDELRQFLTEALERKDAAFEILSYEDGFECSEDDMLSLAASLEKSCRDNGFACRVLPMLALGRTDGRFFGARGSAVYGLSPVLLEDSFDKILPKVHGNNESISRASLQFGCRVLYDIISQYCCEKEG
jgi:acetylornithine deacetylase/succinyl-diaminopimelate desuccinylase-like protein